jgi:hypothetical protein
MTGGSSVDYAQYPRPALEDIVRLRRQMDRLNLPRKLVDRNVLVGTWNIRAFGAVHPKWDENRASPKRNLRAMAYIVEIVRATVCPDALSRRVSSRGRTVRAADCAHPIWQGAG